VTRANPSQRMVLVTFAAGGVDAAGVDGWLRDSVTPALADAAGALAGVAWRVVRIVKGPLAFSHFATVWMADLSPERVRAVTAIVDERLRDPAAPWVVSGSAAPAVAVAAASAVAAPADGGRRTRACLIVPYTPREGADADGYDQWLREVDNPFFNRQSAVAGYTNWRIVNTDRGGVAFTDFDLFQVQDEHGYERVFGENEDARLFARGWRERWGRNPDAADAGESSTLAVAVAVSHEPDALEE